MIIIAREGFNAYGPNKLAMFAGEIADVEDNFAQQLIDEGKAYEYSYMDGAIVPAGIYVYKLGTTPMLLNDGDTIEMSTGDSITIAAFKHPYSSDTTPEDTRQLGAESDNNICNVSVQNKMVKLTVNEVGTANILLDIDYDIATYNLTVVCEG